MAQEKVVKLPNPDRDESVAWTHSRLYAQKDWPRYNPDELIGRKGLRIYDQMMIDEQVKAVVKFKRDAITARDYQFVFSKRSKLSQEQQAERIAIMNATVDEMEGSFPDALNFVMRGMIHGYSITEKVTKFIEVEGKTYIGIQALLPKPPETFFFFTDEYGNLLKFEQQIDNRKQKLDKNKFIHYVHAPDKDEYYGQSDLREAYRSWYSKDVILKLWNLYLEKMAGGFIYVQPTGATSLTPKERTALEDALNDVKSLTSLILPSGYALQVAFPGTTDAFENAITFHNLGVAKSLLVPNLLGISETGQTGAYAQSQTQLEAFFWTLNADARRLEACLNEQLFKPLADANFADGDWPRFCFKPASSEHIRWVIETWTKLVASGLVRSSDMDEEHLREILDMPALSEEEKTATPLPAKQRLENETLQSAQRGTPAEGKSSDGKEDFSANREVFHYPGGQDHDQKAHGHGDGVKAYHGTASNLLKSIFSQGIVLKPENRNYPDGGEFNFYEGHRGKAVYVTTTFKNAEEFAGTAAHKQVGKGHFAEAVIIEAVVPRSIMDGAPGDQLVRNAALIPEVKPEWIQAVHFWDDNGKWERMERGQLNMADSVKLFIVMQIEQHAQKQANFTILQPKELKIIPHGGKLFTASIAAFNRAVQRVAFSVIDRKTEELASMGMRAMSGAVARAVQRLTSDEHISECIADAKRIEHIRFDGGDVAKIKQACKATLESAYLLGTSHAVTEIASAQKKEAFASMRDNAVAFLEANGARMAGNIADGARAIIQQDLLNAVKFGWSPEQTRDAMLKRLGQRGFATVDDLFPGENADDIDEKFPPLPTYLMTLARTNIFEALNEGRYSYFTDPRQNGFVVALEYSAILDDRTTDICKHLDGFTRAVGDPAWDEFRPPNHWNCRSVLIPITMTDNWDGEGSPDPQ